MTRSWQILTVVAASACLVAVVVIALNLPATLHAESDRTAALTAAADVRVASTESNRLKENLTIFADLRQARQRKNAVLARSLVVGSAVVRP